ncbi:hypothetical protein PS2015_1132 [Pseudohongiella spirulinae]|uniref:Uncharacterized protein n=2 Tax=Pseudohongiella spirulinae TaxID=1249552 RepID=A0A0S2KCV1_9GAMM|nr:hypothetical protein [Pseudohongiella spirulinae]ALO45794.1 hypothetical protein PS2015_1132 [Pseudohongiella spirulinae]
MDLVARYVVAVQRELPEDKRDEIGRELKANILDQLDAVREQHGELTEAQISDLLKAMGRPRTVAQQFVPPRPLIRLSYMPLYQYTLYMVLGILFLLQVLETTVSWLSSDGIGLVGYLFSLAGGFLEAAVFAFASITAAFWLMSSQNVESKKSVGRDWSPAELPAAGPGWQHISLQDIFTNLATYLFLLVVIWYPVFMPVEQSEQIRFIVSDQAHQYLKWVSPLAVLGIGLSLWQLRQQLWNRMLLRMNVAMNLALVAATLILAANGPLIHPDTVLWQDVFDLAQLERSAVFTLVVIALFPLWELGRDIYRLRSLQSRW